MHILLPVTMLPLLLSAFVLAAQGASTYLVSDEISFEGDFSNGLNMGVHMITDETGCDCVDESLEVMCTCTGREIKEFPVRLPANVTKLLLVSSGIETLRNDSLRSYETSLEDLFISKSNILEKVTSMPFINLSTQTYIEHAKNLHCVEVGVFKDVYKLRSIYMTHAPKIKAIPDEVFAVNLPSLKVLRIQHSGLEALPHLNQLKTNGNIISDIDFGSNKIRNLTSWSIKIKAEHLILDHNNIEFIENWTFHGSEIAKLSLKGNRRLRSIADNAFVGLKNIRKLDLSGSSIAYLPTHGLGTLEVLRLTDNFVLREFPSVLHFPAIKEAHLTYPYHCCAFQFPDTHDPKEFMRLQSLRKDMDRKYCHTTSPATEDDVIADVASGRGRRYVSMTSTEVTSEDGGENEVFGLLVYTPPPNANISSRWETEIEKVLSKAEGALGFGEIYQPQHQNGNGNPFDGGTFLSHPVTHGPQWAVCGKLAGRSDFKAVKCSPTPDALSPCEDVMGAWPLRIAVWVVGGAALLGNLAVLAVLLSSPRSGMTVSKFLMCHLAFADLCMGLYLLMLAVVDAKTMGDYFNHAIDWQNGAGCQASGFLTVFSSELSVFTLTVITLERWYAITYAIHLNRRLPLGTAARVMALGWTYAITAATMPLLGISSYASTSICLPMDATNRAALAYLICLLSAKGLAFLLICICYAKMYWSIRESGSRQTPDIHANRAVRSDLSVAKRMAMLVFTDFACWAPIAFFGLTAVAGHPLIDIPKAKILLVSFYPLNSCANPFLYAILTRQYRRDAVALLSKLGMCRGRRSACVHGRTLSTNTNVIHRSSVKALYRSSLVFRTGHRQQLSLTSTNRRRANDDRVIGEVFLPDSMHKKTTRCDGNGSIGEECLCSHGEERSREGSPAVHRGSPHPIKNSYTKVQRPDQQIILRRVLDFPLPSLHTTETTTDGSADTTV